MANKTGAWSYDEFKKSQATTDADKNRQNIAANKPGEFTYNPYEKGDVVKQAEAMKQQHLSQEPGAYQYSMQTQLDDTLNKILNREKFSYDLNGDALYQQYKDQYMLQGQQAMMDTMGQAQAMTGGYGNSYAQQVGQQTYQGYLQQLNDKVPELYQLALDQYNREGQELYNQYGLYADRDAQEYGRHRDSVSDYNTKLDYLTNEARYQAEQDYGKYMDAYNMAYGQHRDSVTDWKDALNRADSEYWNQYNTEYGQYSDNRGLSYQQYQDSVAADQWSQSFAYQQEQDAKADAWKQKEFDEAVRQFDANIAESQASRAASASKQSSSVTDSVSKNVLNKAGSITNNADLANYLDGLVESGVVTEEQADALYAENKQADKAALNKRDWTLVDGGGINWFGGIDNNATVKDQYGNTYSMNKLVDALVAEGMDKKAAKNYVKKLQSSLGA